MRIPFVLACALMSASNAAADDLKGAFDVSGEIGVVSDYRWRGVSLTDNDPALQAGLYAAHESGLYAGVWAAAPTRNSGDLEVDLSIGGAFSLMGGDVDLSVVQYIYPDLDDTDYANFVALYERPVGDWTARARLEYAPNQRNLADESTYVAFETERPIGDTGFTLTGSVGWEEGYFTLDGEKWDYSLGAQYQVGAITLSLAYVDTDEDAPPGEEDVYGAGAVFSVGTEF